jgi:hypothetical protein
MEYEDFPFFRQLPCQKADVEVQKNAMEQRERLFHAQQEGVIGNFLREKKVVQEQVNDDQEHPEDENRVRRSFILLADQQEFDKHGKPYACDKEHFHCNIARSGGFWLRPMGLVN